MSLLRWVIAWASGGTQPTYTAAPALRTFYPAELTRTLTVQAQSSTFYAYYDSTLDGER